MSRSWLATMAPSRGRIACAACHRPRRSPVRGMRTALPWAGRFDMGVAVGFGGQAHGPVSARYEAGLQSRRTAGTQTVRVRGTRRGAGGAAGAVVRAGVLQGRETDPRREGVTQARPRTGGPRGPRDARGAPEHGRAAGCGRRPRTDPARPGRPGPRRRPGGTAGPQEAGHRAVHTGRGPALVRFLSEDSVSLYSQLCDSCCLHILHFFTQRSAFVPRTLVEQSCPFPATSCAR